MRWRLHSTAVFCNPKHLMSAIGWTVLWWPLFCTLQEWFWLSGRWIATVWHQCAFSACLHFTSVCSMLEEVMIHYYDSMAPMCFFYFTFPSPGAAVKVWYCDNTQRLILFIICTDEVCNQGSSTLYFSFGELHSLKQWSFKKQRCHLALGINGIALPFLMWGIVLFLGPCVPPGKKGPMSKLKKY